MRIHRLRSLIVSVINCAVIWFLASTVTEKYWARDPLRESSPLFAIIVLLALGAFLDWVKPNAACLVNLCTWLLILTSQVYAAALTEWNGGMLTDVFVSLLPAFILGLVYLMSWYYCRAEIA